MAHVTAWFYTGWAVIGGSIILFGFLYWVDVNPNLPPIETTTSEISTTTTTIPDITMATTPDGTTTMASTPDGTTTIASTPDGTTTIATTPDVTTTPFESTTFIDTTPNPFAECGMVVSQTRRNVLSEFPLLMDLVDGRIIGGVSTAEGDWPWMVYVYIKSLGVQIGGICGGSLINNQWFVSAAHCYETPDPVIYAVVLGEHVISQTSPNEVFRDFELLIQHPDFEISSFNNDIALIKLDQPVDFNEFIRPICVVPPDTRTDALNPPTFAGETCTTLGWGLTSSPDGVPSDILLELNQIIIPSIACEALTTESVEVLALYGLRGVFASQTKFCAGGLLGEDSCEGDSGGPMMCTQNGTYFLHGITSYGTVPCALNQRPGIYTDVAPFSDWIDTTVSEN